MNKQNAPISVDDFADVDTKQTTEQKRLESLLFDNSVGLRDIERITTHNAKIPRNGKRSYSGSLILLTFLFLVSLSGGIYLFSKNMYSRQTPTNQINYYVSPKLPIPVRQNNFLTTAVVPATASQKTPSVDLDTIPEQINEGEKDTPAVGIEVPLFSVSVGPFIGGDELQLASDRLRELGFQAQEQPGRGEVTMVRLLEGIYSVEEAKIHLTALRKVVSSAFLMVDGDGMAVYAGSFRQEKRAQQLQNDLAAKLVNVSLVDSEVTMNGTMLTVLQADQETAREVAALIAQLGLRTKIVKKK